MNQQVPISEARANLTEIVANVRLLGRTVVLTQRGKPRAAIVPLELLEELQGGIGKPAPILRYAAGHGGTSSAG